MEKLKNYFTQWSTWRGLLLIGAAVAGVHPHIANTVLTVGDVAIAGHDMAVAATGVTGAWEAFRNERKTRPRHLRKGW